MTQPINRIILTKRQTALYLVIFSLMTAFALLCLWAGLQVIAPQIGSFAPLEEHGMTLLGVVLIGCGITYILKNLRL